jgi:hypothetical protein
VIINNNHFINNEKLIMKIREALQKLFGSAGLTDDARQKVLAEIDKIPDMEIKEESGGTPPTPPTPPKPPELPDNISPEVRALIQSLTDQNKALDAKLTELLSEKDANKKTLEAKAKAEFDAKVKKAIEDAVKEGKIGAKDTAKQERFTKLLNADFDGTVAVINELPSLTKSQSSTTGGQGQGQQGQNSQLFAPRNAGIAKYVNEGLKQYTTN